MPEPAKPQVSNLTKFFLPGLALGVLIGGVAGAYIAPKLESRSIDIKPKAGGPTVVARPPAPTGSTAPTEPEKRQPEAPPSAVPTGAPK